MSRVGKKPVLVPNTVKVAMQGRRLSLQGPKGKMDLDIHPRIQVAVQEGKIELTRPTNIRTDRALHGLTRSLIQNNMNGVVQGFTKELDIVGVGFKAILKGKILSLNLGYQPPIDYDIPEGVQIVCPVPTRIVISGVDKQKVGQAAAEIRLFHKPEPYKGKGIAYLGETIRRKQGKTVG